MAKLQIVLGGDGSHPLPFLLGMGEEYAQRGWRHAGSTPMHPNHVGYYIQVPIPMPVIAHSSIVDWI